MFVVVEAYMKDGLSCMLTPAALRIWRFYRAAWLVALLVCHTILG